MKTFSEICAEEGTDKAPQGHAYSFFYESILKPKREYIRNLLEIGVMEGSSHRAWEKWLPNAEIYGVDNNLEQFKNHIDKERIHYSQGDGYDRFYLNKLYPDKVWDVVIDDGCHLIHRQIEILNHFHDKLSSYGHIFIEDVGSWDDSFVPGSMDIQKAKEFLYDNFIGAKEKLVLIDSTMIPRMGHCDRWNNYILMYSN